MELKSLRLKFVVVVEVSLKVNSQKSPLNGFSSSGFYNLWHTIEK